MIPWSALALAVAAVCPLTATGQDTILKEALVIQRVVPYDILQKFFIVAPKENRGITVGGLALDAQNQLYVSIVGALPRTGSIVLLPTDGSNPVTIMRELDRPQDIEVFPDGRGLVFSNPDGQVSRRFFGVSVLLQFSAVTPQNPEVILNADLRPLHTSRSDDGYYHFHGVLGDQKSLLVDVIVLNGNQTYTFVNLPLLKQDGHPAGHTIIQISL
jgi:hypothetical protein